MLFMPITCFLCVCGICHDIVNCSCHKKSDNNHELHRAEAYRKLSFVGGGQTKGGVHFGRQQLSAR